MFLLAVVSNLLVLLCSALCCFAQSSNVHLHWSKLSEQFFLLDPPGLDRSGESAGEPFVVEERFENGVQEISQGCDRDCCIALLSVKGLASGPLVTFNERQAAFIGTGLRLEAGKIHRVTYDLVSVTARNDFLGTSPGVRIGLGSVDGSTPGASKHREWTVNSDGRWSVIGVADWQFDENNDVIWGAESRDGWKELSDGSRIDLLVDLRHENPYVQFSQGDSSLFMSLDSFQKLSGSPESYYRSGFEQPQQLYVRGKALGFEMARFGGDLPDGQPLQANLVATIPLDGCKELDNSGSTSLTGKIAFVRRGGCHFVDKVLHAQVAGALAVIVGNNKPEKGEGEELIIMDAGDSDVQFEIQIPSVFVSFSSAEYIESQLGKYRKSVLASLLGPKFTPASNGWSLLEKGLYPIVWLAPGQSVKVSKCNEEQQDPVVPMEIATRRDTCRPARYLPLASSELSYLLRTEESARAAGFNEKRDPRKISKRLVRSVITCPAEDAEEVSGVESTGILDSGSRVGPILNHRKHTLAWSPSRMVEFKVAGNREPDVSFVDDVGSRYKHAKFGVGWVDVLSTKNKVHCENTTVVSEKNNVTELFFRGRIPNSEVSDGICSFTRSLVQLPKHPPHHLGNAVSRLLVDFGMASLRDRRSYYWEFQVEEPKHSKNYTRTPAVLQVGVATAEYGEKHPRHRTWLVSSTRQWLSPLEDGIIKWTEPLGESFWTGHSSSIKTSMGMLLDLVNGVLAFVLHSKGTKAPQMVFVFNLSKFEVHPDVVPPTAWGWEGVEEGTSRRFPSLTGQYVSETGFRPVLKWVCGFGCEGGESVRIIEHSKSDAKQLSTLIRNDCLSKLEENTLLSAFHVDCREQEKP